MMCIVQRIPISKQYERTYILLIFISQFLDAGKEFLLDYLLFFIDIIDIIQNYSPFSLFSISLFSPCRPLIVENYYFEHSYAGQFHGTDKSAISFYYNHIFIELFSILFLDGVGG